MIGSGDRFGSHQTTTRNEWLFVIKMLYLAMRDSNALNIYTDGSSFSSPRAGGIGACFVFPEHLGLSDLVFSPPGYQQASINQMELQACIYALKKSQQLERRWQRIIIHTDSMYIVRNYPKAMFEWSRNGWRRTGGSPVLNCGQWKELIKVIRGLGVQIDFRYVKGHHKSSENKTADKLARSSAQRATNLPLKVQNIRRKRSLLTTEIGSVRMLGQRFTIRLVTGEYLKEHREYRYRYEVISKSSAYFGHVDFIFSNVPLRSGHEYYVKVNSNQGHPQITKVIRDITSVRRTRSKLGQ